MYVLLVLFSEKCFALVSGRSLHRDHARLRRWWRTWKLLLSSVYPLNVPRYAYGNHHGVLGISILLVKPICCALFLQYFLDFCISSSFCATKFLHDLESVGSATGHPTVVTVKRRGSCFAFSPSNHRKEPLKAQYLKHLMERTDMNDFSKLKYLVFSLAITIFLDFRSFPLGDRFIVIFIEKNGTY